MDCLQIQDLLSQLHDGELPLEQTTRVEAHIATCESCASELDRLRRLSEAAKALMDARPREDAWSRIEQQLDADRGTAEIVKSRRRRRSMLWSAAAACALVVMALAGLFRVNDHELAVDFDKYLDAYSQDPDQALRALFAEYPAEEVDVQTATARVGYRPVVPNALPDGYSVDSIHVMNMPCCKCVKTICRDDNGDTFVIFEHDSEQAVWFGDRPRSNQLLGGVETTVIEFDEQLAATWRVGQRSVTLVGAGDVDDLSKLVRAISVRSNG